MNTLTKISTLVVAGLALAACSQQRPTPPAGTTGSVGLAIQLSDSVAIDLVRYSVTGNGVAPIEGNIPVSDPKATISALIDVPEGAGYTIELAAVSNDRGTVCHGEAMFDVVAGQTTALSITLECHGDLGPGSIEVTASLNSCPVVASVAVAPLAVGVGGRVGVSAAGADPDASDSLAFAWSTSGGGKFAAPNQASTTFTCEAAGRHTLTVAVSDGKCTRTRSVAVTCVP
jgi:hypothetical protein